MKKIITLCFLISLILSLTMCQSVDLKSSRTNSFDAIKALQNGEFNKAYDLSNNRIKRISKDPYARLVRAISSYVLLTETLSVEARTEMRNIGGRRFDTEKLKSTLIKTEKTLESISEDLNYAAKYEEIYLELCPSKWNIGWVKNSELLQVKYDKDGNKLLPNDSRRYPTFRFDHGDVIWCQAYMSFHRAALNLILAFNWKDIDSLLKDNTIGKRLQRKEEVVLTIGIDSPKRLLDCKNQIINGLNFSNASRLAYLKETDDDREWIPNPNQKNYPIPMPMTAKHYDNWEKIVAYTKDIVNAKTAISMKDLFNLMNERVSVNGQLNIGAMFNHSGSIKINLSKIAYASIIKDYEGMFKELFGKYYVYDMNETPLLKFIKSIDSTPNTGTGTFGNELRYLLWIN